MSHSESYSFVQGGGQRRMLKALLSLSIRGEPSMDIVSDTSNGPQKMILVISEGSILCVFLGPCRRSLSSHSSPSVSGFHTNISAYHSHGFPRPPLSILDHSSYGPSVKALCWLCGPSMAYRSHSSSS